jgi:hypothetical protein
MDQASLDIDAVTVVDLADHLGRLKATAKAMAGSFGASDRGYFTPSQDEELRHLLVSYCQTRAALFELIASFVKDVNGETDRDPGAFLIAYAAAIALVDAARFIRDNFADRPTVIAKLNEPEPLFGIPAGLYDAIGRSLTDPGHAWQLHQANDYFDEQLDMLRRLCATNAKLQAVMQIIDELGRCVRVSKSQYAKAGIAEYSRQIVDHVAKSPLLKAIYCIQQAISSLVADMHTLPGHHPRLPQRVGDELGKLLRPGDVCINRKEYAVTNYFLPGYWPHAALYLGDKDLLRKMAIEPEHKQSVLEAQKDGVRIRSLDSSLRADAIAVIRPQLERADVSKALARGLAHEGKSYDFDFDFTRSDRLVCTEVVYRSYEGIGDIKFALTRRVGRLTLASEDLLHMALRQNYFELVAVYAPVYRKRLLRGDQASDALQNTLDQ